MSDQAPKIPGARDVWSVGDPNDPRPNDATFGSESEARKAASEISYSRVVAVWHAARLVALYFERQAWRRD